MRFESGDGEIEGGSSQPSWRGGALAPSRSMPPRAQPLPSTRGADAAPEGVTLESSQWFDRITDGIENERKLKKWSRAKKEAFIRGDFARLQQLSARRSPHFAKRSPATD